MKLEKNTKGLPVLNDGEYEYDPESAVKVSVGGVNLLILTEVKKENTEGEPNVGGGKESEARNREPRVDNSAIENRETAGQDNATPQVGRSYPSTEVGNRNR